MGLSNPTHIIALLVILLLLFGARRLPELGRALGLGMREFKDSVSGLGHDSRSAEEPKPHPLPPAQTTATPTPEHERETV
ncbi:MAG TPA: twin-arginine translocase TatA/TatE family subunit [Gaiellaceae bacterium]|nr:twin-arginine translocase TatA/TatE family subunit [Gaiellaceae bacterium]